MQATDSEPDSYFDYPRRRTPAVVDSVPVSPFTSQSLRPNPIKGSKRPLYHVRCKSDYSTVRSDLRAQPIESPASTRSSSSPYLNTSQNESVLPPTDYFTSQHSTGGLIQPQSTWVSSKGFKKEANDTQIGSRTEEQRDNDFISGRPRVGYQWDRTTSGGVWYERPESSKKRQSQSPSTSRLWLYTSNADPLPSVLTPLPPPRPQNSVTSGLLEPPRIKIEKSFTQIVPKDETVIDKPIVKVEPASRKGSVSPRQIFSAPLLVVRKFSNSFQKRKANTPDNHKNLRQSMHAELRDHQTQIKRHHTLEELQRVTTILHALNITGMLETSASLTIDPLRHKTVTSKSSSSKDSIKPIGAHMKMVQGILSPPALNSPKSIDRSEAVSYTSSQRNLKMGSQPNNSPDEKSTFKVKRSPSTETEEFFKVDISVWGGTSYLPSEARRVHTPPLPEDGPSGRRRGFFFDYNAPHFGSPANDSDIDDKLSARDSSETYLPISKGLTRMKSARKGSYSNSGAREISNIKQKGDWYDTKLAELDSLPEDELPGPGKTGLYAIDEVKIIRKKNHVLFLDDLLGTNTAQKLEQKPQFDLTIPEHLPTSPLCPRNPRYWRVAKAKGSQFRGCWMHGVGLYER